MPVLKNADQISGFSNLSEHNKQLFTTFLKNFYAAWEYPERWIPKKVSYAGEYLRVDFKNGIWLHVLDVNTWY